MNKKCLKAVFASLVLTISGFSNAGLISYTGTIESWSVATSGTYRITAIGAQGASAQAGRIGGRGTSISGLFDLFAGDTYFFAVGGAGTVGGGNGGGGGGSFFVDALNNALLVAGGGGGTRASVYQNGCDALITSYGGYGSGSSTTSACGSKSSGLGQGGIISASSWGSAGAGFFSDGAVEYGSLSAKSWFNGVTGGIGNSCGGSLGGFGGGGTGSGCNGGGGGGGYSGGDGGRVAGGGGSFNTGYEQLNTSGAGYGNGSIEWTLVRATDVPEPSTLAIFALGIIGLASRRFKKQ